MLKYLVYIQVYNIIAHSSRESWSFIKATYNFAIVGLHSVEKIKFTITRKCIMNLISASSQKVDFTEILIENVWE